MATGWNDELFELFEGMKEAGLAAAPKKTYIPFKKLLEQKIYDCSNFRAANFKYGPCVCVTLNQDGDWTVLPHKISSKMNLDRVDAYNTIPWTFQITGYDKEGYPYVKFEERVLSQKHLNPAGAAGNRESRKKKQPDQQK